MDNVSALTITQVRLGSNLFDPIFKMNAGDNCETPVCQNGGKLLPSGTKCSCPTGYSGDACQFG